MNEHYFTKLCWVCLAEEEDMFSLLDSEPKIQIDSTQSPVSLAALLEYVTSAKIFFIGGPYLLCKNCKLQACTAYKFKRRCEVSSKIFTKCTLTPCDKNTYSNNITIVDNSESAAKNSSNSDCISLQNNINTDAERNLLLKTNSEVNNVPSDEGELNLEACKPPSIVMKKRKSPAGSNKFLCPICGLRKSKSGRRQHLLTHENLKTYLCPFCPKRFNDKGNLIVHTRIHTGIHPYTCDVCGKSFIQSNGLKAHKRVHDDSRPFRCHMCPYSTRTSSHLQLHIKRHTGVKNYHCEHCEYSACSKAELKNHSVKHSGEKCHICKICDKGFARYKGLKIHEKSHSGEKPYLCKLCSRRFTQGHSMRSHLKTVHNILD